MSIPISYSLRNLIVRKTTTAMTALGIALTVAVLLTVMALVDGLRNTLSSSGDPLNVLALRKGSESELVSNFARTQFQDLKFKPGIAVGRDGQPLASLEMVTVVNMANAAQNGTNLTVRGLGQAGIEIRPGIRIASGRWFQPGRRELVVGSSAARRYPEAGLGKKMKLGRGDWDIVGVMEAGNTAQGSEIWGDLNQISADFERVDVLSSALVRAVDAVAVKALSEDISNDRRLNMTAEPESAYYGRQTTQAAPVEYTGFFVAIVMAVGSGFAAMNTMYAAVARRAREIGTLRVLGFDRASILLSFVLESALLSAIGGALGCLLAVPLNGLTTSVGNANFSETAFSFHLTAKSLLAGMAFAVVLGCAGGFFPARMAAKKEILDALRDS
jgi:putative ABC transport system permease protein